MKRRKILQAEADDETPAKVAKVEVPSSGFFGGMVMASTAVGMLPQPIYSPRQPMYASQSVPMRMPAWPSLSAPMQPWLSAPPAIPTQPPQMPLRPPQLTQQSPQPLFPIQKMQSLPSISAAPPPQPLFPIRPAVPPPSAPLVTHPQPLFPINGTSLPQSASMSSGFSVLPPSSLAQSSMEPRSLSGTSNLIVSPLQSNSVNKLVIAPPLQGASSSPLMASHMYASGPNTGGPSIGPPPVISNKAPVVQGVNNEVYLVWDDEVMSMEERRLSLHQYQVQDETLQMNSVDAAIDRRISESRLAGRIGFGI